MKEFYDVDGRPLGRAWSAMKCKKTRDGEEHIPHVHNPEFAMYGPYMCGGFPEIDLYDTASREPVNR